MNHGNLLTMVYLLIDKEDKNIVRAFTTDGRMDALDEEDMRRRADVADLNLELLPLSTLDEAWAIIDRRLESNGRDV